MVGGFTMSDLFYSNKDQFNRIKEAFSVLARKGASR